MVPFGGVLWPFEFQLFVWIILEVGMRIENVVLQQRYVPCIGIFYNSYQHSTCRSHDLDTDQQ